MNYLNEENFDEFVKEGLILVDFYADWCPPCKMLAPELEELSEMMTNAKIAKVNTEQAPTIAQRFGIINIPTMILFKNGEAVARTQGFQPALALKEFILSNE